MNTLSSANVTDVNLVLKECTHKIKIKYSMHQYSILMHILGNWLIRPKFGRTFGTRLVSLPKPSVLAECYSQYSYSTTSIINKLRWPNKLI